MTKETRKEILKYGQILLGILLCTIGYNMFLIPNDLAAGGYAAEKIHVIGDARAVGNLMSVIHEAYELCYKL